jgi:serine-threonine kinase receptor-associated protein
MASGTSEAFYFLTDYLLTLESLDIPKVVPLTCHGHSRPVPHISFSSTVEDDQYYLVSACKGGSRFLLLAFRMN